MIRVAAGAQAQARAEQARHGSKAAQACEEGAHGPASLFNVPPPTGVALDRGPPRARAAAA